MSQEQQYSLASHCHWNNKVAHHHYHHHLSSLLETSETQDQLCHGSPSVHSSFLPLTGKMQNYVVDEKIIQAANSKDSPLVMLTFKSCGVLLVRKRKLRTSRLDIDRDRCRSDSLSSVSSLSASWESSKEIEADTLGLEVLLLTKHGCGKFDLPKGHMEIGETEIQTAYREVREETGIPSDVISLDSTFRFETVYHPHYKRLGNSQVEKTLVVFLGRVPDDCECESEAVLSEHESHVWVPLIDSVEVNSLLDPLLRLAREYILSKSKFL